MSSSLIRDHKKVIQEILEHAEKCSIEGLSALRDYAWALSVTSPRKREVIANVIPFPTQGAVAMPREAIAAARRKQRPRGKALDGNT